MATPEVQRHLRINPATGMVIPGAASRAGILTVTQAEIEIESKKRAIRVQQEELRVLEGKLPMDRVERLFLQIRQQQTEPPSTTPARSVRPEPIEATASESLVATQLGTLFPATAAGPTPITAAVIPAPDVGRFTTSTSPTATSKDLIAARKGTSPSRSSSASKLPSSPLVPEEGECESVVESYRSSLSSSASLAGSDGRDPREKRPQLKRKRGVRDDDDEGPEDREEGALPLGKRRKMRLVLADLKDALATRDDLLMEVILMMDRRTSKVEGRVSKLEEEKVERTKTKIGFPGEKRTDKDVVTILREKAASGPWRVVTPLHDDPLGTITVTLFQSGKETVVSTEDVVAAWIADGAFAGVGDWETYNPSYLRSFISTQIDAAYGVGVVTKNPRKVPQLVNPAIVNKKKPGFHPSYKFPSVGTLKENIEAIKKLGTSAKGPQSSGNVGSPRRKRSDGKRGEEEKREEIAEEEESDVLAGYGEESILDSRKFRKNQ